MPDDQGWPTSMREALQQGTPASSSPTTDAPDSELPSRLMSALADRYEFRGAHRESGGVPILLAIRRADGQEVEVCPLPASQAELVGLLRQLVAPHVVSLTGSEILADGTPVLIAERIPGRTLREHLESAAEPLPEPVVRDWMRQVGEGMTYVAALGVVHRNLKPANILIDQDGQAQVIGFHHAALANATDGPVGTPCYSAPEQFVAPTWADERSDIYAWGATFFHALAAQPPDDPALRSSHGGAADSTTACTGSVSAPTTHLLRRSMAVDPRERFQSFVELLTQLDHPQRPIHLDGPPPHLPGFHLLSCLGAGGMGIVYKGRSRSDGRLVALKLIRQLGDEPLPLLARFRLEAAAVACLRHPNIVPIVEVGAFAGHPYLALDYVAGGSLHSRLSEFRNQPRLAAEVVAGIAAGLEHAHRLGILHRDLKPQNILLTPQGVPRITDFGLAKFSGSRRSRDRLWEASIAPPIWGSIMILERALIENSPRPPLADVARQAYANRDPALFGAFDETISLADVERFLAETVEAAQAPLPTFLDQDPTLAGDLLGTPAYMAPEQTLGDAENIGAASDLYALGVILYQLLSGQLPFAANNLGGLFDQIRRQEPAPLPSSTPAPLAEICRQCLAKRPSDRPASARAIRESLQDYLARPEPPPRRWWWPWNR